MTAIDKQLIASYRAYLKMYGEMMIDLSAHELFIGKLIKAEDLSDFEQALRQKIEAAINQL